MHYFTNIYINNIISTETNRIIILFLFSLQYGSDEFAHDSPRYTSPGAGTGYYLGADGTPNTVGSEWPSSYSTSYQTYEAYGLIPETEPSQGLPPMSSLRPNGTPTVTTIAGSNNSTPFGPANHTDGVVNKALGVSAKTKNKSVNITKSKYIKTSVLRTISRMYLY